MVVLDMQVMKKYIDHGYQIVKPIVNYALGWLSPELLGTGFNIKSATDSRIIGLIPYTKFNCDYQGEIHLGLVTNSALELVRQMLARHLGHSHFHIENLKVTLCKENSWNKSLQLTLNIDEVAFDQFCIDLQKNNSATMLLEISIHHFSGKSISKFKDQIQFEPLVRSRKLLT